MISIMSVDYKSTVYLPKTDFPMKAGLAKKEPELLAYWELIGLYKQQREQAKGREKFILHDGPPTPTEICTLVTHSIKF